MANKIDVLKGIKEKYSAQKELYSTTAAAIEQIKKSVDYSEEYKQRRINLLMNEFNAKTAEAKQEIISMLNMARAKENTRIDPNNAALMGAINTINMLGDKLDSEDIKAITGQFSGDMGSLKAIKKICDVKGLSSICVDKMMYDVDEMYQGIANGVYNDFTYKPITGISTASQLLDEVINLSQTTEETTPTIQQFNPVNRMF